MKKNMIEKLLEKCEEKISERKYDDALGFVLQIKNLNPHNAEAVFQEANVYHLQGKIGLAVKTFKEVLRMDPDHTDAMISLSVLLNDIGFYDEARKFFEMADSKVKKNENGLQDRHINKKFSHQHFEMGELYFSYQRFDEAIEEYTKSFRLDGENLMAAVRLAKAYDKKGFTAKAVEQLKEVKSINPKFAPARIALGLIYYGQGHVIEAQNEWQNILSSDPENSDAHMYLKLSSNATETSVERIM